MLANSHDCYTILVELEQSGIDVTDALHEVLREQRVPKIVVDELVKREDPVAMFYLNLNNKAHKIIKELLTSDGTSPIGTYLKLATSIITQGIIAIEHVFDASDVSGQNRFIECLGLKEISEGLSIYFTTADIVPLINTISRNKQDVKLLLD